MLDYKVGDHVRVAAARRRDVTWRVTEVVGCTVVAVNDRGGEIRYTAEALEHVEQDEIASPTTDAATPSPPLQSHGTRSSAGSAPSEIRDSTVVVPGVGEPIESVLKRFKKAVDRSSVLNEFRKHRCFVAPSQRRRLKSRHARARRAREDAALLAASRNL